jgi:hypothetical protein
MRNLITAIICIIGFWIFLGITTFALRHPDMTDTERLIHFKEALLFERVSNIGRGQ